MNKYLVIAFSLIASTLAYAGDEHGHNHEAAVEAAPHGGILRDAPPFKAELVINGENTKIYIYEKAGDKLVPAKLALEKLKGQIRLPKDKKDKPITFVKKGDSWEAKIAGIAKVHRFDMHVTLLEKGKKITLDFGIDNIH